MEGSGCPRSEGDSPSAEPPRRWRQGGGPAKIWATSIHVAATGPHTSSEVSLTLRRWVTTGQKSRAGPRMTSGASSGPKSHRCPATGQFHPHRGDRDLEAVVREAEAKGRNPRCATCRRRGLFSIPTPARRRHRRRGPRFPSTGPWRRSWRSWRVRTTVCGARDRPCGRPDERGSGPGSSTRGAHRVSGAVDRPQRRRRSCRRAL